MSSFSSSLSKDMLEILWRHHLDDLSAFVADDPRVFPDDPTEQAAVTIRSAELRMGNDGLNVLNRTFHSRIWSWFFAIYLSILAKVMTTDSR